MPRYEHAERGNPNYQPGGRRCQPPILAAIRDRREAASERERCAKEAEDHTLQSHDLIQQTRAADAAQAQAHLSYEMVWMGVYGTIGGFLTLLAAAAAAFYARDAARAGNKSLEHSKEASDRELRPWLELKFSPDWFRASAEVATISYDLKVTNIGKTPAKQVYREARIFNQNPENGVTIPAFFSSDFEPEAGARPRTILPQGSIDLGGKATMPREEVDTVMEGERPFVRLILAVRVVYAWGYGGSGQTCLSFVISAASGDATIRPIPLRTDERDTVMSITAKRGAFDNTA